jgi:molybdopterin converting factor small subunit
LRIKVRFVGSLARKIGREATVELMNGTNLASAVRHISEKYGFGPIDIEGGGNRGYLVILLNGRSPEPSTRLKDGDEISFLPTLAGG